MQEGSGKITNNRPRASESQTVHVISYIVQLEAVKICDSSTQESTRPTLVDDKHLLGPFFYYLSSLTRRNHGPWSIQSTSFHLPFIGSISIFSMFVPLQSPYIYLTVTTATTKSTDYGANERVFYSLVSMQGWRLRKFCSYLNVPFWSSCTGMEDAHAVVLDLEAANEKRNSFFAVYDGHGGAPYRLFLHQKFEISLTLILQDLGWQNLLVSMCINDW